jgi:UDP-glucose:(heptosyl)LPS alpha-1,3-glucosyltransferase
VKIGLVRRGFSRTGGAEAYLRRFAEAAREAGHECVLFASDEWPEDAWPHEFCRTSGKSPRAFADSLEAVRPSERCDFLFSLERVWRCDAYRAGDGVHAAWLQRRAAFEPGWRNWLRRLSGKHRELLELERQLFSNKGARLVIANSHMVRAEIEQHFRFPSERLHVIHNGVPPFSASPHARAEVREQLGLSADEYVILFAGSGWERKGLRFAIEAVSRAENGLLLVAGRGRQRRLPASGRTRFLGPVADLPRYLAAADIFLLPTLYEPFSNACLEAVAAGLPVITTRANGFAEIIKLGTEGEAVTDPRDIASLADALDSWASIERRETVRPRLQALGARYSIEANVRETLALIEQSRA